MENYDYTYELPNKFVSHIQQLLQQKRVNDVAEAFVNCEFEFVDLGLAYYAGLVGNNWNKHAIDITFEGTSKYIDCLLPYQEFLLSIMNIAIRSNETGLIVRSLYFFKNDLEDLPSTNEDRLNMDIENANMVLKSLIEIGTTACKSLYINKECNENIINDYFRDSLHTMGYREIKDQTRHGISKGGKDAAEIDILLSKDGKEIAIFEGFKLDSVNKPYIAKHIDKAITNYNVLGTSVFIVSYVSVDDYKTFWEKFSSYIASYEFPLVVKRVYEEKSHPNATTRVADVILSKDGYDFLVCFITFKIN